MAATSYAVTPGVCQGPASKLVISLAKRKHGTILHSLILLIKIVLSKHTNKFNFDHLRSFKNASKLLSNTPGISSLQTRHIVFFKIISNLLNLITFTKTQMENINQML